MSRWWLEEEEGQVVLLGKNGQRARSKSGNIFGAVVDIKSEGSKVVITTAENRCVSLDVGKFAPMEGTLIHNLSNDITADEFSLLASDILPVRESGRAESSTPCAGKRRRSSNHKTTEPPAKRQVKDRVDAFDIDLEAKCLGEHTIPLTCLKDPPPKMLLRPVNKAHKEQIKEGLKDTKSCSTVLPVLVVGDTFSSLQPESSQFYTLGGNHLVSALRELSDDVMFEALKNVRVNVFRSLDLMQALRVASLHNLGTHFVHEGSFLDNVKLCRRLLYSMEGRDEDLEEPPSSNKLWRTQCALALGRKDPVCPKALKALEPTYQVAQYSQRCFAKFINICERHEENKGQCLKQTAFLKLQGLSEETRFELLVEVVSERLSLKDATREAERIKKLNVVQKELLTHLHGVKMWQEAETTYPLHTTESALQPFTGCNFKNGIPRPFLCFLDNAKEWRDKQLIVNRTDDGECPDIISNDDSTAVFLENYSERTLGSIKGFTGAVAIIADMEENTNALSAVKTIIKSSGQVEGRILVKATADTLSLARRALKEESFQHLGNWYRYREGGTMSLAVRATWRLDGAIVGDNSSDVLLQDEPVKHFLQDSTREEEWIFDLTKTGEGALFAAKTGRQAVCIQPDSGLRRKLKKMVAQAMQARHEDNELESSEESELESIDST